MRFARFIHASLAVSAAVAVALSACGGKKAGQAVAFPDSLVDDELIASVGGQPVTGRDLKVFTLIYQPSSRDSLNSRLFNLELLNGYIDRVLLWQEAKAVGIAVEDSTQSWFVNRFVESMGGPARVDGFLATVGIARGELESTIRRDLMVRSFIENRIGAGVAVTEVDAEAYYANNPERFTTADSVRARHIVAVVDSSDSPEVRATKRRKIESVLERARRGEDFALLAHRNSDSPSAAKGGDIGYFARKDMIPEFADAAFALQPGQISDVVETLRGYHIIKVDARKAARKIPYDEVKDQILEGLKQQALASALENHLKRNRAVAIIEPNFDFGGLTQRESTTFTR